MRSLRGIVRRAVAVLRPLSAPLERFRWRALGAGRSVLTARRRRKLRRAGSAVRAVSVPGGPGLCGRVVERYSAGAAAAEDLDLVAGVLDAAGIPYFLVPGMARQRYTVGVEEPFRARLLAEAAARLGGGPAYAAAVPARGADGPGGAAAPGGRPGPVALWADGRLPRAVRRAEVLRVGVIRLGEGGHAPRDPMATGCDIEFWRSGEQAGPGGADGTWLTVPGRRLTDSFRESLVAPRPNRVSEVVPVEARKPAFVRPAGREVPTFQPFAETLADEVTFPVDAVFTWVDGSDPALAERRRRHLPRQGPGIAAREVGASRYTSHDELKYSLRSLAMYAPFVRHVYLVTDQQVPSWLDTSAPGLTVVDHREILPHSALPVFNSHAIESRLHRIPRLAERYLYFNDDVFLNRPMRAEDFFHANGIARIPFSPLKLGLGPPHPLEPAPNSAGKNVRELLLLTHGRFAVHKFLHTPHPQIRAVMEEIEEAGFEALTGTTHSRFRAITDLAPAATLHHHWALLTGRAVPGEYKFRYIDVGKPGLHTRLARLAGADIDVFCLNDVDTAPASRPAVHARLRAFLTRTYPFRSPWELPA
ncbi:stealth family protein [Streptomyces aidingensis]|uniref:Stealth protein CR3, conserved region 3 n=1 Tax=Streptomyces aidingensis TaxID=910347 RepID=A0A1I1FR13_9ACTN|nr:stealth family protein [Streptomyces aidingensis]SFB99430.1 Stealth protein CR3, conserved region 3 [Streptomyces aidingensis]